MPACRPENRPGLAQAAYNLGVLLADERPDKALDFCRKAHSLRPHDSKYAFTLAFYQKKRGDVSGAVQTLQPLLKLTHVESPVYELLGEIYETQQKSERACHLPPGRSECEPVRGRAGHSSRNEHWTLHPLMIAERAASSAGLSVHATWITLEYSDPGFAGHLAWRLP